MSKIEYEDLLRGYNLVLSGLKILSDDICVKCIDLEMAKNKVDKRLKKLEAQVKEAQAEPEDRKKELITRIENFATINEEIPLVEEPSCQKTSGLCKLGDSCWAVDLVKLIPD